MLACVPTDSPCRANESVMVKRKTLFPRPIVLHKHVLITRNYRKGQVNAERCLGGYYIVYSLYSNLFSVFYKKHQRTCECVYLRHR